MKHRLQRARFDAINFDPEFQRDVPAIKPTYTAGADLKAADLIPSVFFGALPGAGC
jgi:hypothetical protein